MPTSAVRLGDTLIIKPGAKVPVDARVDEGESDVDESVVTGESLPVSKSPGSELIGGSINKNGNLRARATRIGSDTALAQIVKLVQEAQNSKAPGQQLADRAAFWLVLVALVGGTATLATWLLAGSSFSTAILFAITVVNYVDRAAISYAIPLMQRDRLFSHPQRAAPLDDENRLLVGGVPMRGKRRAAGRHLVPGGADPATAGAGTPL